MSGPELKTCPFCGSPGQAGQFELDIFAVGCVMSDCPGNDMIVKGWSEADEAIAAWNRRADLPPTLEQAKALPEIKALVEALRECISHCQNTGRGNALVNDRIYERVEETARAALRAIGDGWE